ncbi:signal peptidase I [Carnobacterium maltaromaticum]|uniref:signal peptidase I n=1 Tax=Carnobacterium maltaromaticum TaxID=2751 RepID=UPI00191BC012|nr:signal peptidase I [Carnobacterium maltaromaticum]CAD5901655.1 hypothetical protein CMALT394_390022 [Carnobacterium maltaromaticum]
MARNSENISMFKKKSQQKVTNWKKKQRISKSDLHAKSLILEASHELIQSCEKLQREINTYSDGINKGKNDEQYLLDELSRIARTTAKKTYQIKKKIVRNDEGNLVDCTRNRGKKRSDEIKKSRFETVFFYSLLLFIVIAMSAVFNGKSASGVPRNIVGYAPMTILTKSMQSVYPQHSLVVTKVTEPKELVIGDDITYIKENNTTVTHRIIGINENYMDTGERGFETKGVENPRKDEEVIRAENVIGKVVFSSIVLGKILLFVRENLVLTAITVIVFIYFIDALVHYIRSYLLKKNKGE